ncbi:helix-turn-helix domain-containing protein [Streptomyces sp. STCH 565 A]|uniref:helix-turn-helix domain-containing protein n=1 Tax=Streptomyces sp. STCH 565 A TaxID=2950532 RepID=UPI00207636F8|nr:helix-turn-helix domain-containing protein [Streptomyces sp. STCH 565 A]MCM8555678.1 helix-turn-helix domain-containing protein [Streptomyces sp. STCH 565 A]
MHNRKGARPHPPKGCLWIEDAAAHLGMEPNTLRKWRVLGKGPIGFKVGRFVTYKVTDLDDYLDSQYRAATQPDRVHDARPPEPRTRRRPARAAA